MAKPLKQAVVEALEPATMSLPAMDRPSVFFARLLDNFKVETDGVQLWFVCDLCSEAICAIEQPDTMRVLLNTVLAHGC